MRNLLLGALFVLLGTITASANTFFYNTTYQNWQIFGDIGNGDDLNPACVISYEWRDGSEFQLIFDLVDRELWIWFQNFEWDIADTSGYDEYYTLNMVIVGSGDNLESGELGYYLVNKNTIDIPDIEPRSFLNAFAELEELRFIMPGNIQNAYLALDGSRGATNRFNDCIKEYNGLPNL